MTTLYFSLSGIKRFMLFFANSSETASQTKKLGVEGWLEPGKKTESLTRRSLLTVDEVLRLPHEEAILILRGQKPLKVKKMDYTKHPEAKKLITREISEYRLAWAEEVSEEPGEEAGGGAWAGENSVAGPVLQAETAQQTVRLGRRDKPQRSRKRSGEINFKQI